MIHARFAMAHRPSGCRTVQCQTLAGFQILLRVALISLDITNDPQYLHISRQWIVVTGPGPVVGHRLVGFRENRLNPRLQFRREVLDHGWKQVAPSRLWRSCFLCHVGTAEYRSGVEQAFAIQCLGHSLAHLVQLRSILF